MVEVSQGVPEEADRTATPVAESAVDTTRQVADPAESAEATVLAPEDTVLVAEDTVEQAVGTVQATVVAPGIPGLVLQSETWDTIHSDEAGMLVPAVESVQDIPGTAQDVQGTTQDTQGTTQDTQETAPGTQGTGLPSEAAATVHRDEAVHWDEAGIAMPQEGVISSLHAAAAGMQARADIAHRSEVDMVHRSAADIAHRSAAGIAHRSEALRTATGPDRDTA